ncbi:uncharacterized esterase/lipase C417.12 [Aspergillus udagawae]|uniref:Carboxylic ester hydrolase n=1 Tax=Aspergillus udagawae TaxID=91492 RepID=A0A8H3XRZ4_9EURO|nr:uncharacterized esterase/lipase C417.12 [Aspergillus udagawae]
MTPKDSDNVTEEILVLDLSGKPDGIFNKSIVGVVLAHPVTGEKKCQRFTGIPFAQPPIGDLRWEKPVPLEAPNTLEFDEDCLRLNIWRPVGEPPMGGWPVFVYYHGGFLQFGDANYENDLDFTELIYSHGAKCIFVAPMYRLSVLGFLASADLNHANFGLWDQRMALEWTYKNISAFGGNSESIGIGGYSAGSYSAFLQLQFDIQQPADQQIIRRVALQSNCPITAPISWGSNQVHKKYEQLLQSCGIPASETPEKRLRHLRGLNMKQLLSALATLTDPVFRPVLDESFISSSMMLDIYNGTMARAIAKRHISILFGYTQREEAVYGAIAPNTEVQVKNTLRQYFPERVISAAWPLYVRGVGSPAVDWPMVFGDMFADLQVRVGGIGLAKELVSGGVPTSLLYRYEVQWRAQAIDAFLPPEMGATHGSDAQLVWFATDKLLKHDEKSVVQRWVLPWVAWVEGRENVARSGWRLPGLEKKRVLESDGQINTVDVDSRKLIAVWEAIKAATI